MTENEVVDVLSDWLSKREQGYRVLKKRHDTQPGHDIEAEKEGTPLFVECKGSKSNKRGLEFSSTTKFNSAASAFFNQMRLRIKNPDVTVGIAFPDDNYYRITLMKDLKEVCKAHKITVFWVAKDGRVTLW